MMLLEPPDLVVSISNSGSSSRARETVLLAKRRGIPALGVTGSLTGPLAQQADLLVHRPVGEQLQVGQVWPDPDSAMELCHELLLWAIDAVDRTSNPYGCRQEGSRESNPVRSPLLP